MRIYDLQLTFLYLGAYVWLLERVCSKAMQGIAAVVSGVVTPHTVLYDEPITVMSAQSQPYTPRNFDHEFVGAMTAREALARSRTVCVFSVAVNAGLEKVIQARCAKERGDAWRRPSYNSS